MTMTNSGSFIQIRAEKLCVLLFVLTGFLSHHVYAGISANEVGISPGYELVSIAVDGTALELNNYMEGMRNTGATAVRADFPWSLVQGAGPNDHFWAPLDKIVQAAINHNLEVVAMIAYTPGWANGGQNSDKFPPATPAHIAAWGEYAHQVGLRYIPQGVTTFEIWNEANIETFWKPQPNPAQYVQNVLIPAFNNLQSASDSLAMPITVLTAGTAPASTSPGGNFAPKDFLEGVYAAGGKNYFDGVAHHPYTWPYAPTAGNDSWNAFLQSQLIYNLMQANGDGAKKIWATEVGWPTGSCEVFDNGNIVDRCISESEQALRVQQFFTAWRSYSFYGPVFWYAFRDLATQNPNPELNDPEDFFGLEQLNQQVKPALAVFHSYAFTDSDGDTVADTVDNCFLHANPLQIDTDNDGYGNRCDPDLNNDLIVNFIDLSQLANVFLQANALADFNGDGSVNFFDVSIMTNFFFQPPGPGSSH